MGALPFRFRLINLHHTCKDSSGLRFSQTRPACGVLTDRIENRIVSHGVGGSPPPEPGSPDDRNLVPPTNKSQNYDPEMAPKSSQNYPK